MPRAVLAFEACSVFHNMWFMTERPFRDILDRKSPDLAQLVWVDTFSYGRGPCPFVSNVHYRGYLLEKMRVHICSARWSCTRTSDTLRAVCSA